MDTTLAAEPGQLALYVPPPVIPLQPKRLFLHYGQTDSGSPIWFPLSRPAQQLYKYAESPRIGKFSYFPPEPERALKKLLDKSL